VLLATLDYARPADSASKSRPLAQRLGAGGLLVAFIFALLALVPLLAIDLPAVGAAVRGLLFAGLATWWCARLFRRRLGGYTGDCLGATQQVAELAFYLGLLATWTGN
jgi:adenosylcobinamide-GDP ribazoletransferase